MRLTVVQLTTGFIITAICCFAEVSAKTAKSQMAQEEFLQRLTELQVGLNASSTIHIRSLAENCFDVASIRYYQQNDANFLPQELCAVKMLLSILTEEPSWNQLPLFTIPRELEAWLSKFDITQDGFLSQQEIEQNIDDIAAISNTPIHWGVLDPDLIKTCRSIIEKHSLLDRVAGTFHLPPGFESYSEPYLNWIARSKSELEAFQNKLEGLTPENEEAARRFSERYVELHRFLQRENPIRVIPLETESGAENWRSIQAYMMQTLDRLLIPSPILDWTQLLDEITNENWEGALTRLDAIEALLPTKEINLADTQPGEEGSPTNFRWRISYVFWTVILLSGVTIGLILNSSRKIYPLAVALLYSSTCLRLFYAPIGLIPAPESVLLFCGVAMLILPAITFGMMSHQKWIFTLLASSWILCLLFPRLQVNGFESPLSSGMTTSANMPHYAAMSLIAILTIRVSIQLLQTPRNTLRTRDLDRVVYPSIWFAMLLMVLAQMLYWVAAGNSHFFASWNSVEIGIFAIISLQIVRLFILRWTNQLNPAKLLLLLLSITLLGAISVATRAFHLSYSQGFIVLLFWMSSLLLLCSYCVELSANFLAQLSKNPERSN